MIKSWPKIQYFLECPTKLGRKISFSPNSYDKYIKTSFSKSLALSITTPDEFINVPYTFKPTHTSVLDGIDPMIAIPCINLIAQPLSEIINCSFTTGVTPSELKLAKNAPIFKREKRRISLITDQFPSFIPSLK